MKSRNEGFLVLDDADYIVFMRLHYRSDDFKRLQSADQKILVWLFMHQPKRVRSWVEYVARDYQYKGINVNSARLLNVLEKLQ